MKLLISEAATWTLKLSPSTSKAAIRNWHYYVRNWCSVASSLDCLHSVTYTPDGAVVVVHKQECSMQEEEMNYLFNGFLFNMFHPGVEWIELEGDGCEFAMKATLTPRTL